MIEIAATALEATEAAGEVEEASEVTGEVHNSVDSEALSASDELMGDNALYERHEIGTDIKHENVEYEASKNQQDGAYDGAKLSDELMGDDAIEENAKLNESEQLQDSVDNAQNETGDASDISSLEPNSYLTVNEERVRTDDNGKIHMKYNKDTGMYELLPNNTYEVNGYKYETDEKGRIVKVEGQLKIKDEKRSVINTDVKDMKPGDERGHLIADQFGGSNLVDNLVPMGFDVNRSDYKKLEEKLAKEVNGGKDVYVDIRVEYEDSTSRPYKLTVEYTMKEEFFETSFINYTKGENQNV